MHFFYQMNGITAACFALLEKFDVFKFWSIIRVKDLYSTTFKKLRGGGSNLSSPGDLFTSVFLRRLRISSFATSLKEKTVFQICWDLFNFWKTRIDIHITKLMNVRIRLWSSWFFYYVNVMIKKKFQRGLYQLLYFNFSV